MKPGIFYIFLFFFGLISNQESIAAVINIPADYTSIQQGIDSASTGDTVLVQPGTYFGNLNYHGKDIIVASLYFTTADTNHISATILSPSSLPTPDGSIVTFETGETQAAQLIGFTLTGGTGNPRQIAFDLVYYGGAIYCHNASPKLSALIITNNTSECGGGIFMYSSNALVEKCLVKNNVCNSINFAAPDAGGGIVCWNCANAIIRNTKIHNNTVSTAGAGIYSLTSTVSVINCLITDNYSMNRGSAFYADSWSYYQITNCTVYGNRCDYISGPGVSGVIYCIDSAHVRINNSIFQGNTPSTIVCQFNYSESDITVSHTDFEGGMDSIITNGNATVNWLSGNLNIYPQFIDTTLNDFHLQNSSPCINAGDTTGLSNVYPFDLDSNNRFVGTIDMGCYENQTVTSINETDPGEIITAWPNPFFSELIIPGTKSQGEITVYDQQGKLILHLQAKEFETRINLENFNAGLYLLKYNEGNKTVSKLMLKY